MLVKIKNLILGSPRSPFDRKTKQRIALTALLAWVGLGADGLSSSCYGPEQAFLALKGHTELALYLAIMIAITVFVISFAYNQVIELFPNGGGGYKVASKLLGKYAGLVAGSALIVDYILTISISIASGTDAVFSLFPLKMQAYKLEVETGLVIILIILNMRGMKESIKVLLPIFVGFIVTHFALIGYGVFSHGKMLPVLIQGAAKNVDVLTMQRGLFFVIAIFIYAYSLGGGTYTGLEAVSNNVNMLTEPRVRTGKWTMFYMAVSLSVTAGGIILLYLLWNVQHVPGETLNATVFHSILQGWMFAHPVLIITLLFEAGLLFLSANTGLLGGPAVLANMAIDRWVPGRFRNLSSRLTKQNGIILFGIAALLIVYATNGHVAYIVVLYTINVFLAFTISILGLCNYWWRQRKKLTNWIPRLLLSSVGALVCGSILIMMLIGQVGNGSLIAMTILGIVVVSCLMVRKHYDAIDKQLVAIDRMLVPPVQKITHEVPAFNPKQPTAVFFVDSSRGLGMHTLLWVQRLFPNRFKNFVFVQVGVIDVKSYGIEKEIAKIKHSVEDNLDYYIKFANQYGIAAKKISDFGTDPTEKLIAIAEKLNEELEECIFFASKLVFKKSRWLARILHNETVFSIQRRLYLEGMMMMIMPMKV